MEMSLGDRMKGYDGWVVDTNIPIFTQNRDYIESRINFD